MIARSLILAGGVLGGASFAQFPEYSQQYLQRLAGTVDALGVVVADFDASARASGLSRDAALAQLSGTAFLERRRADMARTIARHERLSADLATFRQTGPLGRLTAFPARFDTEIANAAMADFRPALPVTVEGATFAGAGLATGAGLVWALLALIRLPLRRWRTA